MKNHINNRKKYDFSNAKQRFSIKKFKFGAASVLVGLSFLGANTAVLAEDSSKLESEFISKDIQTNVSETTEPVSVEENSSVDLPEKEPLESNLASDEQFSKNPSVEIVPENSVSETELQLAKQKAIEEVTVLEISNKEEYLQRISLAQSQEEIDAIVEEAKKTSMLSSLDATVDSREVADKISEVAEVSESISVQPTGDVAVLSETSQVPTIVDNYTEQTSRDIVVLSYDDFRADDVVAVVDGKEITFGLIQTFTTNPGGLDKELVDLIGLYLSDKKKSESDLVRNVRSTDIEGGASASEVGNKTTLNERGNAVKEKNLIETHYDFSEPGYINLTIDFNKDYVARNYYNYIITLPKSVGPMEDLTIKQFHSTVEPDMAIFEHKGDWPNEFAEGISSENTDYVGNLLGNYVGPGYFAVKNKNEGSQSAALFKNANHVKRVQFRLGNKDIIEQVNNNIQDEYYVLRSNTSTNRNAWWQVSFKVKILDEDAPFEFFLAGEADSATDNDTLYTNIVYGVTPEEFKEEITGIDEDAQLYTVSSKGQTIPTHDAIEDENIGFRFLDDGTVLYYYPIGSEDGHTLTFDTNEILKMLTATNGTNTIDGNAKFDAEANQNGYKLDENSNQYYYNDQLVDVLDLTYLEPTKLWGKVTPSFNGADQGEDGVEDPSKYRGISETITLENVNGEEILSSNPKQILSDIGLGTYDNTPDKEGIYKYGLWVTDTAPSRLEQINPNIKPKAYFYLIPVDVTKPVVDSEGTLQASGVSQDVTVDKVTEATDIIDKITSSLEVSDNFSKKDNLSKEVFFENEEGEVLSSDQLEVGNTYTVKAKVTDEAKNESEETILVKITI
ncbi:TPA: YSIRK-type signal peptide-containing protein, partial [Streptococcus equi subsp. zooepidemicus]|nr:YSIRK-type signal peptide-containing protein [Streptococcus equi subsp. zooepidemicus]